MSYLSRVYRQRNPRAHEDAQEKPFFSKQHDRAKSGEKQAFFQAKLSVNQPGDSYEHEADAVAHSVVSGSSRVPVVQQKKISSIQRLSSTPEEEKVGTNDQRMERDKEKPFQRMSAEPEKEKPEGIQKMDDPLKDKEEKKKTGTVQAKHDNGAPSASQIVSSQIESSSGKGKKLPPKVLHEMNTSFGLNFSHVRIHNDNESANMNKELQAQAFTHGNDIYFNQGKYNPENAEGQFLLAHELTHVVQQGKADNVRGNVQRTLFPIVIMEPRRLFSGSTSPGPGINISWSGQSMRITANLQVYGPAATNGLAQSIKSTIERVWNASFADGYSVSCNVNISFRSDSDPEDSSRTQIKVINESGMTYTTNSWLIGSQYIHYNLFDADINWTPAHEFAHLIGLPDHYSEGVISRLGGFFGRTRTATVDTGWEGNIMSTTGGILESKNIKEWLELHGVQYVIPGSGPTPDSQIA